MERLSAAVKADSSGNYSFTGLANGAYWATTPSKSGFTFSPTNEAVTISGASATAVNFTAMANSLSISWDDHERERVHGDTERSRECDGHGR